MKGSAQSASGATPWAKQDVKDSSFLYQHKYTEAKSHSVKLDELMQLKKDAIDEGKTPVYVIEFKGRSWFMVPDSFFYDEIHDWWNK